MKSSTAIHFFRRFPNLKSIEFTSSPTCDSDFAQVARPIFVDSLSPELMVSELAKAISHGACPKLEVLSIKSFFFHNSQSQALNHLISELMRSTIHLRQLNLSANFLSDTGAVLLAKLIESKACVNLESLELRKNFIGELGAEAISTALVNENGQSNLPALAYLGLSGNLLTARSIQFLADAFLCGPMPQLQHLDLENNFISNHGVYALIQALGCGQFTSFERVTLSGNKYILNQLEPTEPNSLSRSDMLQKTQAFLDQQPFLVEMGN